MYRRTLTYTRPFQVSCDQIGRFRVELPLRGSTGDRAVTERIEALLDANAAMRR
jgi:hypothetical protein